jgi:calcium/calmodulin-dependent protein kinase kinase 2
MKAIRKFKAILAKNRLEHAGGERVSVMSSIDPEPQSFTPDEEKAMKEQIEGLLKQRREIQKKRIGGSDARSHAPGIIDQDLKIFGIGTGSRDAFGSEEVTADVVAESPTAVDFNVYDRAYEEEVDRILSSSSRQTTLYLTGLVKEKDKYSDVDNIKVGSGALTPASLTPAKETHNDSTKPASDSV